jgi:predicted transcriptional regulator
MADDTTTMTVRIGKATSDKLEALARGTHQSSSALAAQAIDAFVESSAWQVEAIREAVEKADAGGRFYADADIMAWLESWGTEDELEPPETPLPR